MCRAAMASLEDTPVDKCVLSHGIVQHDHGALFLLLPLFCGLLSLFWYSFLQISILGRNALIIRRQALCLRRMKLRNRRLTDGSESGNGNQRFLTKQSSNGSARLSRKLSRRSSDFALDPYQQNLSNCQKENAELKKELSQVDAIKSKFADLLKVEAEKSRSVEKELKISQSQILVAVSERDRSLIEIEKLRRREDDLMESLGELQDRLDQSNLEYSEEKSLCTSIQKKLEKASQEVDLYRKVVEKFWDVRSQTVETTDFERVQEKAARLLQDDEGLWSYGESNKVLSDECKQAKENLVILQVEFQVCCDSFANCQAEIKKEIIARKQAETALLDCRQQLSCLAEHFNSEIQQLRSVEAHLKEDVAVLLSEEKNWILSLPKAMAQFTNKGTEKTSCRCGSKADEAYVQDLKEANGRDSKSMCTTEDALHKESLKLNGIIVKSSEVESEIVEESEAITGKKMEQVVTRSLKDLVLDDETGNGDVIINYYAAVSGDDNKKALAQALQEKVAALLLLSQQEERHILEANTNVVLETEISFLKQQLLQVTSEKVEALIELARAHEELLKLQEQEKTFKQAYPLKRAPSSGQVSSAQEFGAFIDNDRNAEFADGAKKPPAQSYLKQLWQKGPELGARTKSLSHMLSLKPSKENDSVGIARLRVENATLRESLTSIRHLCKSANRLRLIIARIAAESSIQTESSIQAAVDAVDGVISEALHLKVALHSSLPVDDLGWNSIGSPLARADDFGQRGEDHDANDDLNIVTFFGLEIVRLVLLAAQLQKRFLGQNV